MIWLLDTNVVSEWTKPDPSPAIIRFLSAIDEEDTYLSVVTLAELRRGIDRLPAGKRRRSLEAWLVDDLTDRFENRIVPIDPEIAGRWGILTAAVENTGHTPDPMDTFIAATALARAATLVTRNRRDFVPFGVALFDPWSARPPGP